MSVSQSNLSDPKYGYDLVVAVTQAGVNATMKQYLAGLTSPEVIACYVYDANNNLIPIDYATLKANADGSDPFLVPNGSNPETNQDLKNLALANFAGAVKAMIGLPAVPLANLPPIVTLGSGSNAPVLFNLLCSEFQITGFEYGPRGSAQWINQSQPTGAATPWYFSANVSLNRTTIEPSSPAPVAVQQRIQQLMSSVGPGAFSIQQLFLELDTAILESAPSFIGLPPWWPIWTLISNIFLGAYFQQLQQSGQPVLSYSVAVNNPTPATLELGAISHECCALLNGNGQPIVTPTPAQQNAATFVYAGTAATTPPVAVPFGWNWVELGDVSSCSGVQAVRRDIFLDFLANLLNQETGPLCLDTNVSLTHSGDNYTVSYTAGPSATPAAFTELSPIGPPGADGFTDVLSLSFAYNGTDNSEASDHLSSIYGDFNFVLTGPVDPVTGTAGPAYVAVNGNQVRITLRAAATMDFYHHELGVSYIDLPTANYYDKTLTVIYTLGVGQNGNLTVTQTNSLVDASAAWNFTPGGILGVFGFESDIQSGLTTLQSDLATSLDAAFTSYAQQVANAITGYHGWVFPAADSFVLSNVAFSSGQDLVTQLVYANPN